MDAFTDPLMGRISDSMRIRGQRRRPYFLIACVPFAVSFALLWVPLESDSQWEKFVYYAGAYSMFSVALTALLIPYLALVPEMAVDYDERTSLQTYLNIASTLGIAVAIGMRPLAAALSDGSDGFLRAASLVGLVGAVFWLAVHRVSFERPEYASRAVRMGLWEGIRSAFAQTRFLADVPDSALREHARYPESITCVHSGDSSAAGSH